MESKIFNAIGMNIDPAIMFIFLLLLIIGEFVLLIVLLTKYGNIKTSYDFFMAGRKGKDLEEEIMQLLENNNFKPGKCKIGLNTKNIIDKIRLERNDIA